MTASRQGTPSHDVRHSSGSHTPTRASSRDTATPFGQQGRPYLHRCRRAWLSTWCDASPPCGGSRLFRPTCAALCRLAASEADEGHRCTSTGGGKWHLGGRRIAHDDLHARRQWSSSQLAMTTAIGGSTAATTDTTTAAVVDQNRTRFQASRMSTQANAHQGEVPPLTPAQSLALRPVHAIGYDALVSSHRLHHPTLAAGNTGWQRTRLSVNPVSYAAV